MRLLALWIAVVVTSSATAAGPTCALLDPEKTPRAALFEAKLLAEPGATWVERSEQRGVNPPWISPRKGGR